MKKIFWGFFFVFINFNLTLNGHTVNLLPDFVGYILLHQAAGALAEESGRFRKIRPFTLAMAVYTGILWTGDLLGVTGGGSWLDTILSLAALVISLYISWSVVQAILELESARGADLNGASVRTAWFILLTVQIAGYAAILLLSAGLGLMVGIAGLVGIIWFLAALWKCAKRCEDLPPKDGGLGEL